ncbi:MAG: rhomboid family intramembrane serine protease [Xanthobacteraceae bacterium]
MPAVEEMLCAVDASQIYRNTFCAYLAKQFVAKKGFKYGYLPEAAQLASASNIVLTRSDGHSLEMLCLIDRESEPDRAFDLHVEEVAAIGSACLRYSGRISRTKMPVWIKIIEIGHGSAEQQSRLQSFRRSSLTSKVIPSAIVVDTESGRVWSNSGNWLMKGAHVKFIERVLASPRQPDAELRPQVTVVAPAALPVVTIAIAALLVAVFALENIFGIGPATGLPHPTTATLVAFGGLSRALVVQSGEWYRMLSAPLLHLDAAHLAMNLVALFLAGSKLEALVGRAWFGAVFVIGALGGSSLSLLVNPVMTISVGASGAIMALFAAMLVASLHFPVGAMRTRLQLGAMYVLIPSLLPLAGALQGQKVDYGAHFGGAICGAVLGAIMLRVWPRSSPWPSFRRPALIVGLAGIVALAYPILSTLRIYPGARFSTELIPADKLPRSFPEWQAQAADLIKAYPRDPRPHFIQGGKLLDANDRAGAENEARAGLSEETTWRLMLPEQLSLGLHSLLALSIVDDRRDEAQTIAAPACRGATSDPLRKLLDARKLC